MATAEHRIATFEVDDGKAAGFAERALALKERLNARGLAHDRDRRLSDETIAELIDGGILQMLAPRAAGGAEASMLEFLDTSIALAQGDGATAWLFGILGSHHWVAAHFPPEGQAEVFGEHGEALFPLTFSGKGGTATPVEGGYRISGHWSFASGIDFSDWVGALAKVEGADDGVTLNVVMRRDEVEVIDNWFMAGMRGTGSRDFVAKDVFVPARRTLPQSELMSGRTPGAAHHAGYRRLRTPLHTVLLVATIGAALGLARRAIDDFIAYSRSRVGYGGMDIGAKPATHIRIARCLARWDAVHDRVRGQYAQVTDLIDRGEKVPAELRLAMRRDAAFAAAECSMIVGDIAAASGARAQHETSAVQLIQRDMNTVRTHVILNEDDSYELYGRHALGLDIAELSRQ